MFFSLQTVYSRKFQITVEKKAAPSSDLPFGTVMTKLKLFCVVERKTKSLTFDLTKILLPKRLVLLSNINQSICVLALIYSYINSLNTYKKNSYKKKSLT